MRSVQGSARIQSTKFRETCVPGEAATFFQLANLAQHPRFHLFGQAFLVDERLDLRRSASSVPSSR